MNVALGYSIKLKNAFLVVERTEREIKTEFTLSNWICFDVILSANDDNLEVLIKNKVDFFERPLDSFLKVFNGDTHLSEVIHVVMD